MRVAFALYGQVAGVIERTSARTSLRYLPEYIARPDATPLSVSMPVADVTYASRQVEAYLKGLLPDDEEVRDRWARRAGVRPGDTLGLLASIGLDVSGGAMLAPEDQIQDALTRPGHVVPASEADIAGHLRRLRQDAAAWRDDEEDEHWSLAGAQSKFTLARVGDGWGFAKGAAASTHIIKPGIGRIRAQAMTEHVTMRALSIAGLDTASTQLLTFEDQPAVVVERFDRLRTGSGHTIRVHQEDLVQAFALDPKRKYEADGGPGAGKVADLLRSVAAAEDVERFVRAVIANQVIGAPDAHSKNYGLLLAGRSVALAPLYDVATGLVPDGAGRLRYTKGAMSIGGERRFGDVERTHWERFGRVVGLRPEQVVSWVDELTTTLPAAFERAAQEVDGPDAEFIAAQVVPAVAAVAAQTAAGLSATRRSGGRLVTPFMATLGQPRAAAGVRRGGELTPAARAEHDVDLAAPADREENWG